MTNNAIAVITALALSFGMFSTAPTSAQTTGESRQTGVSEHHQRQYELMKDMSQEMNRMTEQMSAGDITPEQRKQMSQHMKRMSKMMDRMSGLGSRPAMRESEMSKQMAQMRKEMDGMMHKPSMKSPGK